MSTPLEAAAPARGTAASAPPLSSPPGGAAASPPPPAGLAARAWRALRPRERAGTFAQLRGPRELLLFAPVTVFAATVPALMRLPLARVAKLVTRPVAARHNRRAADRLPALVALAPRLAHPLVRTGCLPRGVTLFVFLRRAGVDVELRFGLDPATGDAHCWLTHAGEPYAERQDVTRFAETYRFPAP